MHGFCDTSRSRNLYTHGNERNDFLDASSCERDGTSINKTSEPDWIVVVLCERNPDGVGPGLEWSEPVRTLTMSLALADTETVADSPCGSTVTRLELLCCAEDLPENY